MHKVETKTHKKTTQLWNHGGKRTTYRMAGNICGNYIVQFHEKITGFLFAELNIALYCVHSVTPTH